MSAPALPPILLAEGTLPRRIEATLERATLTGALRPIDVHPGWIDADGARFLVPQAAALRVKAAHRTLGAEAPPKRDPFAPWEDDLFVADLTATHVGIVNKFPVVREHLLIITRGFEEQEAGPNPADFAALWAGLREYEGLGFYNAGAEAGASQRHKHLQLVPLPLDPGGPALPLAGHIAPGPLPDGISRAAALPFRHALGRVEEAWWRDPLAGAGAGHALYLRLRAAVGLPAEAAPGAPSWNLLVTRTWMMLVPRRRESWEGISINALGFVGSLLVRDDAQRERLTAAGPFTALAGVGFPP